MVGWCPNTLQRRQHPIGVIQVWHTACAFPTKEKDGCMNLFAIIGVIVVVLFIVGYLRFYYFIVSRKSQ